jgi:hypothetical protein
MPTVLNTTFVVAGLSLFLSGPLTQSNCAARTEDGKAEIINFYVSRQGKDTWSGKLAEPRQGDGPFATVARARSAVRSLLMAQKGQHSVRVVIRGGTYYLDSPLEFGPADSGTARESL